MSDPFAFLNPIASTKTDAEKVLASSTAHPIPPVTIAPLSMGAPAANMGGFGHPPNGGMGMNMGMNGGMGMGMNAPPAANPYGGGMNTSMNMGGGMGMGMGMGMGGMGMGAPMGMPNANAQFPPQQQQPVMYDNIKNLLQQKPKPPAGAFGDDASMDFLEHLGSGAAPAPVVSSAPVASDAFGSAPAPISVSVAPSTAGLDFGLLDSSSSSSQSATHSATTSTGAKSSALADRLAHGKRKTQEAARSQLGFNAGAFTNATAPKISLKDVSGASSSTPQRTGSGSMSVDDFAAGVPAATASSSANVFDDPFQSDSAPAPRTASGSNSSGSNSRTGSKTTPPIATVDNSFW